MLRERSRVDIFVDWLTRGRVKKKKKNLQKRLMIRRQRCDCRAFIRAAFASSALGHISISSMREKHLVPTGWIF